MESTIINFLFRVPAILIALTVHELAHGFTAKRLGDDTAARMGRLSLNPLAHLDLFGTLMLLFGPFGWAKPVPVNPMNLNNPRKDMIWVALAGPLSNLALGFVVALLYKQYIAVSPDPYGRLFLAMLILINIGLAFFNLLPIPPLDGSNIVRGFMSRGTEARYIYSMRYIPVIFLVLIAAEWLFHVRAISFILDPLWSPFLNFMLDLYGVKALFLGV
ncbi:MAG: site-2 protease family protein [Fibrobacterota bacterium]